MGTDSTGYTPTAASQRDWLSCETRIAYFRPLLEATACATLLRWGFLTMPATWLCEDW
jgi:hypothetical protein